MKKIIFILGFYTFYLNAQPTNYFSKSYNFGNYEQAWRIGQCSDGLILSSFTNSKAFTDIIKTDFEGKVIWKKNQSISKVAKVLKHQLVIWSGLAEMSKSENSSHWA